MNANTIVGARFSLFLTAFRGSLVFLSRDEDGSVAGWVTSFRVGMVLVWNWQLKEHQILAQYTLN